MGAVIFSFASMTGVRVRASFQNRNGIAHAMHLVVSDKVSMDSNLRCQIPEPLWKRFKNSLDRVGAETAGATKLRRFIVGVRLRLDEVAAG